MAGNKVAERIVVFRITEKDCPPEANRWPDHERITGRSFPGRAVACALHGRESVRPGHPFSPVSKVWCPHRRLPAGVRWRCLRRRIAAAHAGGEPAVEQSQECPPAHLPGTRGHAVVQSPSSARQCYVTCSERCGRARRAGDSRFRHDRPLPLGAPLDTPERAESGTHGSVGRTGRRRASRPSKRPVNSLVGSPGSGTSVQINR